MAVTINLMYRFGVTSPIVETPPVNEFLKAGRTHFSYLPLDIFERGGIKRLSERRI